MIRNRLTAVVAAVLCTIGILAATGASSAPATASTAPNARAARKECNVKFVVKGGAGETHANLTYSWQFDNEGANHSPNDVKLPWSFSTGSHACNYGVDADLLAINHGDGMGDTYADIYVNGHLVADGFGSGNDSGAALLE